MAKREPNGRLRTLLTDARWSGQDFARAVNGVAAEHGLTLRYDRTSVSHWLSGTRPSAHVVALAAEALQPADRPPDQPRRHRARPDRALRDTGHDRRRDRWRDRWRRTGRPGRRPLRRGPGLLPRLAARRGAAGRPSGPAGGARGRLGHHHVAAAEALLPVFRDADMTYGSGRIRPALTAYLTTTVVPWLSADAPPAVRHRLLAAAARLAYTAGFLCFDGNEQGLAQAYYRAALRLGREAGDPRCHAPALRAMSVQAHHLGHRKQAWELAEAAARHAPRLPPVQAAFVTGQLAVAEAACGDRRAALTQLGRAERLLERATGRCVPIGDYHRAAYHHQQSEVLAALGDTAGAVAALSASLRHRPPAERRARAVTSARLAELQLDRGHLERACATWHELLDTVGPLESARVTDAARRLRVRLRAAGGNHAARALLTRLAPA
ncbi:Protein involved in sporulation OS=Streptomyces lavendulae subsp. lavendulae OX=58340 GN=SLAV_07080 PE=4 SV=1 [Streptomyces lavendulae subsp. lavendulae]